jgi:hypothetical protein
MLDNIEVVVIILLALQIAITRLGRSGMGALQVSGKHDWRAFPQLLDFVPRLSLHPRMRALLLKMAKIVKRGHLVTTRDRKKVFFWLSSISPPPHPAFGQCWRSAAHGRDVRAAWVKWGCTD